MLRVGTVYRVRGLTSAELASRSAGRFVLRVGTIMCVGGLTASELFPGPRVGVIVLFRLLIYVIRVVHHLVSTIVGFVVQWHSITKSPRAPLCCSAFSCLVPRRGDNDEGMSNTADGPEPHFPPSPDSYDGRTNSDPLVRAMLLPGGTRLGLFKLSVGDMDNNVYVLVDPSVKNAANCIIIDAANEADRILELVTDFTVGAIITTHRHADHWQALRRVAHVAGGTPMAGQLDVEEIAGGAGLEIGRELYGGETVSVAGIDLDVIHTPGHTPGSVCLLLRDAAAADDDGIAHHIFTGDTLFPGGPGNTFGSDEAFATIMGSLTDRIFSLPDNTWVYPGHGDDTTLGDERPHLQEWQDRGW